MTSRARVVGAVVLLAASAGCSQPHDEDVSSVHSSFVQAYETQDGRAACAVLAPGTRSELEESVGRPCAEAVLEEQLDVTDGPHRIQVFGTQAIASFGGDTMFLARFPDGWKVTAAGCTPRPARPYDCVISGG